MADIQSMTDEQLAHRVLQIERDLVAARFQHSQGTLENTAKLGVLRTEIAQLKTAARSREIAQGLRKDSLIATHSGNFTAGSAPAASQEDAGGFLSGIVDKLTTKE